MTVLQDAQKANIGGAIELYVLDMTGIGGSVLYMTPHTNAGASNVSFGGQAYIPVPIVGEGWETSVDGAPPRPTLRISNVTRFIQSFLSDYSDLVGAKLTRILTLTKYLDSGATPDGSQVLRSDTYIIEQKRSQNKREVSFVLASVLDNPMKTIPGWKVLRAEFPGAGLYRAR